MKDFYKDPVFKRIRQYRNQKIPLSKFESIIKVNFGIIDYFDIKNVNSEYNNYELYGFKYNQNMIDNINNPIVNNNKCGKNFTIQSISSPTKSVGENIKKYLEKKTFTYKELVERIVGVLKANHTKKLLKLSDNIRCLKNKRPTISVEKQAMIDNKKTKIDEVRRKLEKLYYQGPSKTTEQQKELRVKYKQYIGKVEIYVPVIKDMHKKIYDSLTKNCDDLIKNNLQPPIPNAKKCTSIKNGDDLTLCEESREYEYVGVSKHKLIERQITYYIKEFNNANTDDIKKNIIKNVINLIKNEDDYSEYSSTLKEFHEKIKNSLKDSNDSDISKLGSELNSLIQEKNDNNKFSEFHTEFVGRNLKNKTWSVNNWSASVLKDYTENKVNIPTYLSAFDESYMY